MQVATSMASKIVLEVERKFCGLAVPRLTNGAGKPPFVSLYDMGQKVFKDTYYDKHEKLSSFGLWVRKRELENQEPKWEAKHRQGGTFTNSMFEELTDVETIARKVREITGCDINNRDNFGLSETAAFTTTRRTWKADGLFNIVLDAMDFGHEVGEVELERSVTAPAGYHGASLETWKAGLSRQMDFEIEKFMTHYSWAFHIGTPEGKLTAYRAKEDQRRRKGQRQE